MEKSKSHNKGLLITILTTVVSLTALIIGYRITENLLYAYIVIVIALIGILLSCYFLFKVMADMSLTLMDDYLNNQNLVSGVLLIILLLITTSITISALGKAFFGSSTKEELSVISAFVLTLAAPLISLLGVHYSNTLQKIEKQKDIEAVNKPFISIDYKIHKYEFKAGELNEFYADLIINNMSNNICIPVSYYDTQAKKLNYFAINNDTSAHHEDLEFEIIDYDGTGLFELVYKDILNNIYIVTVTIDITTKSTFSHAIISEPKQLALDLYKKYGVETNKEE